MLTKGSHVLDIILKESRITEMETNERLTGVQAFVHNRLNTLLKSPNTESFLNIG